MRPRHHLAVLAVPTLIAAVLAVPCAEAVAPDDNGAIAFVRGSHLGSLWTMNADGSGLREIHDDPVFALSWSPDGRRLAAEAAGGILLMNADGSGRADLGVAGAYGPAWGPGGTLAFLLDGDIWLTTPGHEPSSLGYSPDRFESDLAWSPHGWFLAFAADGDIWVRAIHGHSPDLNLTETPDEYEGSPSWSPDGRRIAFVRWSDGASPAAAPRTVDVEGNSDIWVMDADGANQVDLTPTEPAWEGSPAWSPDGTRIAFTRDPDPNAHGDIWVQSLWSMHPDGTGQVELTDEVHGDRYPAWQPLPGPHAIGLVDPDSGRWQLQRDGAVDSFFYGDPGDTPLMGDWDCDGTDTPGLHRPGDGYIYLRNSNTQGTADVKYFFGDPGDIPLAGDFDGDDCDTVSLYRPGESKVYVHNDLGADDEGLGRAELSYYFGDPGDTPFAGDFDGDGVDTIGLHRETTGKVYFRNSHTQGNADVEFVYGDPGDLFVAGDWLAAGRDTPAVYRDGTWYFRYSSNQGIGDASIAFGEPGWLPVAGDFTIDPGPEAWVAANFLFRPDLDDACDAVFAVPRLIEVGETPLDFIANPVIELLAGPTAAETAAGYTSWFSADTAGAFQGIDGEFTQIVIDLADLRPIIPDAASSCGALGLLAQLEWTSRQFQFYASDCVSFSFDGDRDAFYDWIGLESSECDP